MLEDLIEGHRVNQLHWQLPAWPHLHVDVQAAFATWLHADAADWTLACKLHICTDGSHDPQISKPLGQ